MSNSDQRENASTEASLEQEAETEDAVFDEMRALSLPTLQEYWINDDDAIYDTWQ